MLAGGSRGQCRGITEGSDSTCSEGGSRGQCHAPCSALAGPAPAPAPPASFSEILRLVRSGQDVPGLHRPNVTASLASPTPSRLARRPKPWERARPPEEKPDRLMASSPPPPTSLATLLSWGRRCLTRSC
uniref:Peroxisomal membrane protein PEX14-like KPWE domain-containing protein n=1 Tax=Terrapene triunguis TaxID=2587831 RepID=A0A674IHQ7_9SAUR